MAKQILTQERLKELLDYNPQTGIFTWKVERKKHAGKIKPGDVAGYRHHDKDYVMIGCCGRVYRAHRLAKFYMEGKWPAKGVDHKDGDKGNNSWLNLRDACHSLNGQNLKQSNSRSKSGLLGVETPKKASFSYRSRIMIKGKRIDLGSFKTAQEAHEAYLTAKRNLHEGCTI